MLTITPPLPKLDHLRSGLARAQEYAAQVHADNRIPLIQRHAPDDGAVLHLDQQAIAHDAGIVHQPIQAPEVRRDLRHRRC